VDSVLNRPDTTTDEIIVVREQVLLCLYNCWSGLDSLRYTTFYQTVATETTFVQSKSLPSTPSAATSYHRYSKGRKYHWNQTTGTAWKLVDGKLLRIAKDLPAAHESILEVVKCNCTTGYRTQRCTNKKDGLDPPTWLWHMMSTPGCTKLARRAMARLWYRYYKWCHDRLY